MTQLKIPLPSFQIPIVEPHTLILSHRYQATPSARCTVATEVPISANRSGPTSYCPTNLVRPFKDR